MTEIQLQQVTEENIQVFRNLYTFFRYDLMPFIRSAPDCHINELGTIGAAISRTHQDENAACEIWCKKPGILSASLIICHSKLAGFVSVARPPHVCHAADFRLNDLFIVNMFRRAGIAKSAVLEVFERFIGTWEVSWIRENEVAGRFWHNVVSECTGGNYKEVTESAGPGFEDSPALLFCMSKHGITPTHSGA